MRTASVASSIELVVSEWLLRFHDRIPWSDGPIVGNHDDCIEHQGERTIAAVCGMLSAVCGVLSLLSPSGSCWFSSYFAIFRGPC